MFVLTERDGDDAKGQCFLTALRVQTPGASFTKSVLRFVLLRYLRWWTYAPFIRDAEHEDLAEAGSESLICNFCICEL